MVSNENGNNEERTEESRMLEERQQVAMRSAANEIPRGSAGDMRGNIQRRTLRKKSRSSGNIVCKCKTSWVSGERALRNKSRCEIISEESPMEYGCALGDKRMLHKKTNCWCPRKSIGRRELETAWEPGQQKHKNNFRGLFFILQKGPRR